MRSRSPPGAGRTKRPSSACRMPGSRDRRQQVVGVRRGPQYGREGRGIGGEAARRIASWALPPTASASIARARAGQSVRGLGDGRQECRPARSDSAARRRRAGRAGSACIRARGWPRPAADAGVGVVVPAGSAVDEIERGRLRLDHRREHARARQPRRRRRAPRQRSIEALRSTQAAIEAGLGDRRRQVADQRRAGAALGDACPRTGCSRRRGRSSAGRRSAGRASRRRTGRPACRA